MDPKEVRKLLNLPEDASEDQVKEAYAALGTAAGIDLSVTAPEPAAPAAKPVAAAPEVTPEPAAPAAVPAPVSAAALPPGTVLVDKAQFEATVAAAGRAVKFVEDQEEKDIKDEVAAAMGDGRIAPASEEHWLTLCKTDPNGRALLASLAPGVVPVELRGHSQGGDGSTVSASAEIEQVANWSAELFTEVREMRTYDAAVAAGNAPSRTRIQRDAAYKR